MSQLIKKGGLKKPPFLLHTKIYQLIKHTPVYSVIKENTKP